MRIQRYPWGDLYTSENGSIMMFDHASKAQRKDFGRPVKKASRRGKRGLNHCGHGSNPHKKR